MRIERRGEVWVVTGDYKLHPDPTCAPVRAAALPHPDHRVHLRPARVRLARAGGGGGGDRRLVAAQPGGGHAAACSSPTAWARPSGSRRCWTPRRPDLRPRGGRGHGGRLPAGRRFAARHAAGRRAPAAGRRLRGALVIAPPAAEGSPWMRRFRDAARAFVSGWMRIRGNRRRRALDRGFVLSDHADWGGILLPPCGRAGPNASGRLTDSQPKPHGSWRETGLAAEPVGPDFTASPED
ncbi:MAG: hypothetical protein MZV70_55600 [Desulfobacterales bacterium]|nr:hypothetical protein [Desulfobacterales bacterium]